MADDNTRKVAGVKKARGLLEKIAKPSQGEVKIHPEDDAIKVLMKAGYTNSESWRKVAGELDELQREYGNNSVLGISQKRVDEAYRNADKAKQYTISGGKSNLGKYLGIVSTAMIAGSALFFTPNITGNVIWGLASENTNMLGVVFFVLGALGLLFSLRQK